MADGVRAGGGCVPDVGGRRLAAAWYVCGTKSGASALRLQHLLGLGSYETAWTWLHKLGRAMVVSGRELLAGDVEVDETFFGGPEPGLPGRSRGKKSLVVIAVECEGAGSGHVRLARIPDASARSLHPFVIANVATDSVLLTDAWAGYTGIETNGYPEEEDLWGMAGPRRPEPFLGVPDCGLWSAPYGP